MEEHHHHHVLADEPLKDLGAGTMKLALQATLHCLLGCGIGEVVGMIFSTYLNLSNLDSTIVSIILGFVTGLALGVVPLLKHQFSLRLALKTVIVGESLSIVVMEAFEAITQLLIPGVMDAHLTDGLFWFGMLVSVAVGFVAALPVNVVMIKRGVRHIH